MGPGGAVWQYVHLQLVEQRDVLHHSRIIYPSVDRNACGSVRGQLGLSGSSLHRPGGLFPERHGPGSNTAEVPQRELSAGRDGQLYADGVEWRIGPYFRNSNGDRHAADGLNGHRDHGNGMELHSVDAGLQH